MVPEFILYLNVMGHEGQADESQMPSNKEGGGSTWVLIRLLYCGPIGNCSPPAPVTHSNGHLVSLALSK